MFRLLEKLPVDKRNIRSSKENGHYIDTKFSFPVK